MIGLKPVNIKTILLHSIFWIAVWLFFIYFLSYNSKDWQYVLWFSGALLPVTILVTYVMVYRIIPNYLFKKKYFRFCLYFFYTTIFTTHSIVIIISACLYFILDINIESMPLMSKNVAFVFILVYLIVGVVSLVTVLRDNFATLSKNKELQNKVLAAKLDLKDQELLYLKKQIHPHFLFNTLNTIYGFALKQSKDTPDMILRLSNLLDYILYQVKKPKVSIREEVMHIQEYIELEKMRFQDTLRVTFKSSEINENLMIAPMLMIPFVENAFKHGSINEGYLRIDIAVSTHDHQLQFEVKNTFIEREDEQNKMTGIGLDNIRKRMEMHYEGDYELNIHKTDKLFVAELSIINLNLNTDA